VIDSNISQIKFTAQISAYYVLEFIKGYTNQCENVNVNNYQLYNEPINQKLKLVNEARKNEGAMRIFKDNSIIEKRRSLLKIETNLIKENNIIQAQKFAEVRIESNKKESNEKEKEKEKLSRYRREIRASKESQKRSFREKFDIALRMKREGDIAKIFLLFDRDEERRRYKYIHTFITEEKKIM